jgi:hypothetical protein
MDSGVLGPRYDGQDLPAPLPPVHRPARGSGTQLRFKIEEIADSSRRMAALRHGAGGGEIDRLSPI